MALKLSLEIVFIVKYDTLIGDRHKNLFSGLIGQIVDTIIDFIIEAEWPFKLKGARFAKIFLLLVILWFVHQLQF